MRRVVVLLFLNKLVACKQKNKTLNAYLRDPSVAYNLDREVLYKFHDSEAPRKRIGGGRRVAIIDVGLPRQDEFFWCCSVESGAPKMVTEVDVSREVPARLSVGGSRRSPFFGCPKSRDLETLFLTRPMLSNHLTKSLVFGYLPRLPPEAIFSPLAEDVEIISIIFRKQLYLRRGDRYRAYNWVNLTEARSYLRSLGRALTFVADRPEEICAVQLSAVDGVGVPWTWYQDSFPEDYGRWRTQLRRLRAKGVWVSAPSGNQRVSNQSALYNWPASDPDVIAIGCYDNITQTPAKQRGPYLDLLVRTLDTDPFTSYCNILAVSTSVLIRDKCKTTCKRQQFDLSHCSADFALFLMQHTADTVSDPDSHQRFYVLTPHRLYDYLYLSTSTLFCEDLKTFGEQKSEILRRRLPGLTTFFRNDNTPSWSFLDANITQVFS